MGAAHSPNKKEKLEERAQNCPQEKLPGRTGMPDSDSIIEEKEFESPSGKKYRILKTDERDEYEQNP
jgi:hypothetical protein